MARARRTAAPPPPPPPPLPPVRADGWVVSLYDRTGAALLPWAEAGYDCVAVDLVADPAAVRHPRIRYLQGDVRAYEPPAAIRFGMGWPPCTHLTSAAAWTWKKKGPAVLAEALGLVHAAVARFEAAGAPYQIENPAGRLATHWRRPDACVDPWMFAGWLPTAAARAADAYTKRTCLWLGGGARLPAPNPVPGLPIDMGRVVRATSCAPSRSVTPAGLAYAIWVANDRPDLAVPVPPGALNRHNYPVERRMPNARERARLRAAGKTW